MSSSPKPYLVLLHRGTWGERLTQTTAILALLQHFLYSPNSGSLGSSPATQGPLKQSLSSFSPEWHGHFQVLASKRALPGS